VNKGWQSRIVGEGEESPDRLLANPRNWRIHPQSQQQALARLLDKVGWVQRVIVNQRTGHVVDGHLRVAIWKAYFTRAYSDKPEWLEAGFADACAMRGDDDVLFVVYGGNQAIRDLAWERGWVWLPEDADTKMSSGRFLEDG
jgi:hypothetical protein